MNNMILFAIIIFLLLVILILIFMLNKSKKKILHSSTVIDENNNRSRFDFSNVVLPKKIDRFDAFTLNKACMHVFDTFKALDYASGDEYILDREEWHVWQVSMLLRMIRLDKEFYIPTNKNTFHKSISSLSKEEIIGIIQTIINRYSQEINTRRSKDELCKEMICTGKEISCVFYFLTFRKSF